MLLTGPPESDRARALRRLLRRYGLGFSLLRPDSAIPGSHWGAPEAGLIGDKLYARPDTPVHSILHETCHYICMDGERCRQLHTDAGGNAIEECAVCYLSILLAGQVPGYTRQQLLADMDAWGYSFRLGSAGRWFSEDAGDARLWLREQGLVDAAEHPVWILRQN